MLYNFCFILEQIVLYTIIKSVEFFLQTHFSDYDSYEVTSGNKFRHLWGSVNSTTELFWHEIFKLTC